MSAMTIVYPSTESSRFDASYYTEKHMKLAAEIWGYHVKSMSLTKGIAALPEGKPPYHAILHVVFNSAEAMGQALASPEMPTLAADVINYTDVEPVVQISEILS